jgi:hypothetical protein
MNDADPLMFLMLAKYAYRGNKWAYSDTRTAAHNHKKVHTNIVIGDSPKVLITETSNFQQPVVVTWHTCESVRFGGPAVRFQNRMVHTFRALGSPGDWIWWGGAKCVRVLSMMLAVCHLRGSERFELAPKSLENLYTPVITIVASSNDNQPWELQWSNSPTISYNKIHAIKPTNAFVY